MESRSLSLGIVAWVGSDEGSTLAADDELGGLFIIAHCSF